MDGVEMWRELMKTENKHYVELVRPITATKQ